MGRMGRTCAESDGLDIRLKRTRGSWPPIYPRTFYGDTKTLRGESCEELY
jgi:hypothetical protein